MILDVIKSENIDLVFAGTHGRHGIKRLVMGSTAEKLLQPCFVLGNVWVKFGLCAF